MKQNTNEIYRVINSIFSCCQFCIAKDDGKLSLHIATVPLVFHNSVMTF